MITCIGVGPGDLNYLTQKAVALLRTAHVVAGFDSVLNFVSTLTAPEAEIITLSYRNQTEKLELVAKAHHAGKQCVVGFMGDVHFSGFQLLERVERACGHPVETVAGISSAQILACRTRVCFDETTFITFHRRGDIEIFKEHLVHVLVDGRNAIVIPHPWDFMPKDIAAYLTSKGVNEKHPVEVWENLTQTEGSWKGYLGQCNQDFSDMSIMLIRALNTIPSSG